MGRITERRKSRPTSIVVPIHHNDLDSPVFRNIIDQLNSCECADNIIIPLAAENVEQYRTAHSYFGGMETNYTILWCNGSRIQQILEEMKDIHIDIGSFRGKGLDVWMGLGIATLDSYAIAVHDGDIRNYTIDIPIKLLYPIIDPELNFFFNKGYYARVDIGKRKMHGRVYRLFIQPLLDTLNEEMRCDSELLQYFKAFRYTLSGEFAMTSDFALNIRIPADWGLEMGLLAEVYRNATLKRICQTDLGFYDHQHKSAGKDTSEGLCKMADNIFATVLRILTENTQATISIPFLHSAKVKYKRLGQDAIRKYYTDAYCNNLNFSRHEEEMYVDMFSDVIMKSGEEYLMNPKDTLLPDWTRVLSAIPDLRERFSLAALEDRKEFIG
jgi:glucosyl-3-phosphoglycerate synthase